MAPGYVLITGASEGLGHEFAKLFAADHYPLVLVARNQARLAEIAGTLMDRHPVDIRIVAKDLSLPNAAAELNAELANQGIDIEILVNNAGFGVHGLFHTTDWKTTESMLTLNMTTLTHLTRLLLPSMIAKGSGKILNVASTAAFQPGPFMACYFASKSYVLSFTQALSEELSGTGVTATVFCPGPVKTQFQKRANTENIPENFFSMEAAPAAMTAYRDLMRGKRTVIPGFINKLLAILVKISPLGIVLKVTRYLEGK